MKLIKFLIIPLIACGSFSLSATETPAPPVQTQQQTVQKTLALIKPDAVADKHIGAIVARYEKAGLKVVALKMTKFSKRKAAKFYSSLKDKPFFPDLLSYMTSGPIVAVVLEGPDAVATTRALMGATDPKKAAPGTIRADFGKDIEHNAVHGSDSAENARKEIAQFFGSRQIFAAKQKALAPISKN